MLGVVSQCRVTSWAPCRYALCRTLGAVSLPPVVTQKLCRDTKTMSCMLRAVSRTLPLAPVRRLGHVAPCLSRHDTLCRDQNLKMGCSPLQLLPCTFSPHFFFVLPTVTPTEKFSHSFFFQNPPVKPHNFFFLFYIL